MLMLDAVVFASLIGTPTLPPPPAPASDTIRLEVGSAALDLSHMAPHFARVTVERLIDGQWVTVSEWTNELEVVDSAGRQVHRWTTLGRRPGAGGQQTSTWALHQTFDARSIEALGLERANGDGSEVRLTFDGGTVRGTQRTVSGALNPIEVELSRAAYPASASDLVPMGVDLAPGMVLTAPVWQLGMSDVETRVFDVLGQRDVEVAGQNWLAWAIEERAIREHEIVFIGTWYVVDEPPYMIYAEVVGPGGVPQRMTEVLERASR